MIFFKLNLKSVETKFKSKKIYNKKRSSRNSFKYIVFIIVFILSIGVYLKYYKKLF